MPTLRQAAEMALDTLVELEKLMPVGASLTAVNSLREALAQLEQMEKEEPVAWRVLFTISGRDELYFYKPSAERRVEGQSDAVLQPLYLHPAPIPKNWQLVPKEYYEIRNKPIKMKLWAWVYPDDGNLFWRKAEFALPPMWKRVPSEDKEVEVPNQP